MVAVPPRKSDPWWDHPWHLNDPKYVGSWGHFVKTMIGLKELLNKCAKPGQEIPLLLREGVLGPSKRHFYPARDLLLGSGFR